MPPPAATWRSNSSNAIADLGERHRQLPQHPRRCAPGPGTGTPPSRPPTPASPRSTPPEGPASSLPALRDRLSRQPKLLQQVLVRVGHDRQDRPALPSSRLVPRSWPSPPSLAACRAYARSLSTAWPRPGMAPPAGRSTRPGRPARPPPARSAPPAIRASPTRAPGRRCALYSSSTAWKFVPPKPKALTAARRGRSPSRWSHGSARVQSRKGRRAGRAWGSASSMPIVGGRTL